MNTWNDRSPEDSFNGSDRRRQAIVDFWMELDAYEASGGNHWEALHAIRDEVTSSLFDGDLVNAESLTAQAMLLLQSSDW